MPDPMMMDVISGGMPLGRRRTTDAIQEQIFQEEAKCNAGDQAACARLAQLQYEFEQAAAQEAERSGQGAGMGGASRGGTTGYRPAGQWYMDHRGYKIGGR